MARIDPAITLRAHPERLTVDNALEIVGGYDLVLDGSDNFATRYLVADACEILGTPSVWGTILRFEGQVSVSWPGRGATYRDLFPDPPDAASVPTCSGAGVLGVLCAAVGAAMGAEAVKLLTGAGRPLVDRLLVHDALTATWRELATSPDPDREPVTSLEAVDQVCGAPSPRPPGTELSVPEVQELLLRRAAGEVDLEVVDVREPHEHAAGHLDGARLVPLGELLAGRAQLPADRPVLLYCAAGGRSGQALDHLLAEGRTDVQHLVGGYGAWLAEGRLTV